MVGRMWGLRSRDYNVGRREEHELKFRKETEVDIRM
jgi:hypothetical protein